jgi:ADP-ribosylglycohydrolase
VRGLLLGLALGDTLGAARGKVPADGPLPAGVSTQLACFTVEGSIRALVRGSHKGICHPPSVILHAYCRWAALQGIEVDKMRRRWSAGAADKVWPDGWLAGVPALAERRGSAPATVAALSRIEEVQERMATPSRGCHALTRSLPLAAVGPGAIAQAGEIAALTHGDAAARSATAHATALLHHCLTDTPAQDDRPGTCQPSATAVLQAGIARLASAGRPDAGEEHARLLAAVRHAVEQPADRTRLARLAPDPTAPSALLGGLYTAASFPAPADIGAALNFAAAAPDGDSVACVTGALLGAVHGADALPVGLVSRHELAWVLDTLARDLLTELTDSPSGSEYVPGWDPHWWMRYPGW